VGKWVHVEIFGLNFFVPTLTYILFNSVLLHSVPVVLVGNKKDLHMDRVITQEEGKKLADSWKAVFLEASAKQNEVTSKKVSSLIPFLFFYLFCFQ